MSALTGMLSSLNINVSSSTDGQTTPRAEAAKCPVTGLTVDDDDDDECPIMHPKPAVPTVIAEPVDPELLKTSLEFRVDYMKSFIGFGPAQANIINKVAPLVTDMIPEVVDHLYAKLFEFDVTKKIFMERNDVCLFNSISSLILTSYRV
jgi:hypothetical protein